MKYILVFLIFMAPGIVWSGGYHKTVNNYYVDYDVNNFTGIGKSDYNTGLAQMLAADAIHCTTSTRKNQMGIGTGYSNGKNGFALGYCKTFLSEGGIPIMIGGKGMTANGAKPLYSLGVNWTF